jgi:hypothetical protein
MPPDTEVIPPPLLPPTTTPPAVCEWLVATSAAMFVWSSKMNFISYPRAANPFHYCVSSSLICVRYKDSRDIFLSCWTPGDCGGDEDKIRGSENWGKSGVPRCGGA